MSVSRHTIPAKQNATSFCDHEYYGPLIDSYIKSILKSGLLLDEDLEVLLSTSKFRNFPERSGYKPSLSLLASMMSVLSSSFLANKIQMPMIVTPSIIAFVYFSIIEFRNEKRKHDHKRIIVNLLENLHKIQKLNKNVIRYMKTRCDLENTTDHSSLILYSKNIDEFIKLFVNNNCDTLQFLIVNLKVFATHCSELQEDFMILEFINYTDIIKNENLAETKNCLLSSQKIYDINVLLFSKLLSYIGVLLNIETLLESDLKTLINETVPKITTTLQQYHDVTKKLFVSLRHSAHKKTELKLYTEASKRKNISTKLESTLISSVNNLSVILEKSHNIMDRLESGNEEILPEIGKSLVDLRNHTFATYESLDLLCRLYGILSNSTVSESADRPITNSSKIPTTTSESVNTICYDDDSEVMEEKFELYIEKGDSVEEQPTKGYEDQSNAYLSLMLQELKQSLKQHERFIEAKNRRGSQDEDEIEIEKRKQMQGRAVPTFNLDELRNSFEKENIQEVQDLVEVKNKRIVDVPDLPVPPPPPLPSFSMNNLEQETGQINARSMLENIKVLSSQRNVDEEVFGNSDKDSNSSD